MTRNSSFTLDRDRSFGGDTERARPPLQDSLMRDTEALGQRPHPPSFRNGVFDHGHVSVGTLKVQPRSRVKVPTRHPLILKSHHSPLMDLAKRLRTEREQRKLGQHDVAAAIGVARPTVTQWERGSKKPGRANLEALAVFYRVRVDDLLGRSDSGNRIEVETAEEANALRMMREAPPHIRDAVLTLLGTWSGPAGMNTKQDTEK